MVLHQKWRFVPPPLPAICKYKCLLFLALFVNRSITLCFNIFEFDVCLENMLQFDYRDYIGPKMFNKSKAEYDLLAFVAYNYSLTW
jgi:hypothetical protein